MDISKDATNGTTIPPHSSVKTLVATFGQNEDGYSVKVPAGTIGTTDNLYPDGVTYTVIVDIDGGSAEITLNRSELFCTQRNDRYDAE